MIKNIFYKLRVDNFIKLKIGTVILVAIIGIILFFPHFFRNTCIVTITNKRIIRHNNVDTYIIYSQMEDGNLKVFQNTNNLLELKFNSEALYWQLTTNKKYKIKAYGLNIPNLSYYQNIIKVKVVVK